MIETDYLVIGSGIAGLSFALHAAEHGRVIVVTKRTVEESNTNYAQGGIAAVTSREDSFELHVRDTLQAGAGLCKVDVVRTSNFQGKERRRGKFAGYRPDWKKAYVKLKEGQKMPEYAQNL